MNDETEAKQKLFKKSLSSTSIKITSEGVSVGWRPAIVIFFALAGSGGGLAALEIASKSFVKESIVSSEIKIQTAENKRQETVDRVMEAHSSSIKQNGDALDKIVPAVHRIQDVQLQQVSREEARRVTGNIKNRRHRELNYDRLVDLNRRRLEYGKEPCSNIECSN